MCEHFGPVQKFQPSPVHCLSNQLVNPGIGRCPGSLVPPTPLPVSWERRVSQEVSNGTKSVPLFGVLRSSSGLRAIQNSLKLCVVGSECWFDLSMLIGWKDTRPWDLNVAQKPLVTEGLTA